jgi:DNA-binding SARP family transcriptional activator
VAKSPYHGAMADALPAATAHRVPHDAEPPLRLLGPPVWRAAAGSGRADLPFAPELRHQLLVLLACQPEGWRRERLAALFWPHHDQPAARRNLRKLLFRLAALQVQQTGLPPLQEQGGLLRWPVATDLPPFRAALAAGALDTAQALYRGPLAQGLEAGADEGFADWLQFERQRLASPWREAQLQAARQGDAATALRWTELLLADDPLDEAALQLRLAALQAVGRPQAAEQLLAQFSQRLGSTLGLAPAAATLAWRSAAAPSAGAAVPPPATAPAVVGDGSPLIGRVAELRQLLALLADPVARWITVTGPGGIGKSHLLRSALAAPGFPQPAHWVALDDLADTDAAVQRLCAVLGVPLAGGAHAGQQLQQALRQRAGCLVLDNLEHLLPAVLAPLQALLAACPGWRIVSSSRQPAGVPGERLLPLQGLPWPEPEDADRAEHFDAVQLFVQRARLVAPAFELAPQRRAVVALCAGVEGLPLALALCAGWVRHLQVAELLDELQQGRLLDAEDPRQPGRQRSLAAVLDGSWQRLPAAARTVLAVLSVCPGGFTLEAARCVAGARLPVLGELLDRALLRRTGPGGRFGMHPLVQQHAAARLAADAAAQAAARQAHADYYLQLLSRFPRGRWAEQPAFFAEMDRETENLRLAWLHAVAVGHAPALAAATIGLASQAHARTRWDDGLALLAAAEPVLAGNPAALAQLQCSRALLASNRSDDEDAARLARQALRLVARRGDARLVRASLFLLGQSLRCLGDLAAAQRCYAQSLRRARDEGDPHGEAMNLHTLAEIACLRGRHAESAALAQQSLDLQQRIGVLHVDTITDLGLAQHLGGDAAGAAASFARARAALDPRQPGTEHTHLAYCEAVAAFDQGRLDAAAALCGEALRGLDHGGQPAFAGAVALLQSRLALAAIPPNLPAAARLVLAALQQAQQRRAFPAELAAAVHAAHWLQCSGQPALQHALLQSLAPQADRLPHDLACWAAAQQAALDVARHAHGATPAQAWAALTAAAGGGST